MPKTTKSDEMILREFKTQHGWIYRMLRNELHIIYRDYLWKEARSFTAANNWLNERQAEFFGVINTSVVPLEILRLVWHEVIP